MSTPCTPSTEAMKLLGGEYPDPVTDQSDLEDNVGRSKRLSLTEFLKSSSGKTGDNTDTELMSGCSAGEDAEDERRPKTPEIALIPFQTSIITSRDDQASSKSYKASDDMERFNEEELYNQPSEEEDVECEAEDLEEPVVVPEVPIHIEDASGIVSISEQSTSKYRLPEPKTTSDNEEEESSSSSEESESDLKEEITLKQAIETVTASQIRRASIRPEQIDVIEVSENESTLGEGLLRRDVLSPIPPAATGEDVTDTEDMIAESDVEEEPKAFEEHTLPEAKREITRIKEICPGEAEQVHIEKLDESRYLTDAEYRKANVPTDTEDFEVEGDIEEDELEEAEAAPEVMLPECSLVEFLETEKRSLVKTVSTHSETENEDADNPKKKLPSKPFKEKMASRETDVEDLNAEKV